MRPVVELIANLTLAWQMRAPGAGRNTDANRRLAPSPATAGGSGTDGVKQRHCRDLWSATGCRHPVTLALPVVDSTVAQALRLLGRRVTLGGISSDVALALTRQEIALSDIATVRSPQEALQLQQM
jgi:hypothetical protein